MSVLTTLPVRGIMKVKVVNDHVNNNLCQNYHQIDFFVCYTRGQTGQILLNLTGESVFSVCCWCAKVSSFMSFYPEIASKIAVLSERQSNSFRLFYVVRVIG